MGVKEDILIAGSSLLREKGVAALTQPQIAQAAKIKQSHLTYYFPKRADLLLAIAEFTIFGAMDNVALQLQKKPQGKTLADAVSKIMIDGLPPRVFLGLIVAADNDPDIRKLLRRLIRHVRTAMRHLLQEAGIAADEESARLFHATIIGLAVMHQARLNKESANEVLDGVNTLIRVLTPKQTKRARP
ncbi:MAG: TetR/AcrR family transcriptional regulator [Gammaproteobacteria bacterium]|nr:TetR/AcrR family transcriptional regulator [Gammaproteobacteria bacterium]MBU1481319.1 TetR/AcrR family transcriptional regulator [Gammaproteobacteria bacterium]